MTAMATAQQHKTKEIVCDILELDPETVTDTGNFIDDYEADSLRAIEILSALEQEFDVVIDQSELSRMVDLQHVYEVLAEAGVS